jgi:hypothetical protein
LFGTTNFAKNSAGMTANNYVPSEPQPGCHSIPNPKG